MIYLTKNSSWKFHTTSARGDEGVVVFSVPLNGFCFFVELE